MVLYVATKENNEGETSEKDISDDSDELFKETSESAKTVPTSKQIIAETVVAQVPAIPRVRSRCNGGLNIVIAFALFLCSLTQLWRYKTSMSQSLSLISSNRRRMKVLPCTRFEQRCV